MYSRTYWSSMKTSVFVLTSLCIGAIIPAAPSLVVSLVNLSAMTVIRTPGSPVCKHSAVDNPTAPTSKTDTCMPFVMDRIYAYRYGLQLLHIDIHISQLVLTILDTICAVANFLQFVFTEAINFI